MPHPLQFLLELLVQMLGKALHAIVVNPRTYLESHARQGKRSEYDSCQMFLQEYACLAVVSVDGLRCTKVHVVGRLSREFGVDLVPLVCLSVPHPLDIKLVVGVGRRLRVEELDDLVDKCIDSVLVFTINLFSALLKICKECFGFDV